MELNASIRAWADHFNRGEYFEAHEVLECVWMRASERDKPFLKGLIQAAVALHHLRRGNRHGARVKQASAIGYLEPYPDPYLNVPTGALVAALRDFVERWLEGVPGCETVEMPWPEVRLASPGAGLGGFADVEEQ